MKQCCGTCRNFTRMKQQSLDLCEAWSNPTTADRSACDFWLLHSKKDREKHLAVQYKSN